MSKKTPGNNSDMSSEEDSRKVEPLYIVQSQDTSKQVFYEEDGEMKTSGPRLIEDKYNAANPEGIAPLKDQNKKRNSNSKGGGRRLRKSL